MIDVKRDVEQRITEIDLYFAFMQKIDLKSTRLKLRRTQEAIDPNLNKILRANAFLLLYNLVESSMRNALEEIYAKIRTDGKSFDDISDGIKREILSYLRSEKIGMDRFIDQVNLIAVDILEQCIPAKTAFSGNIDARKIREVALLYGFSSHTNYRSTKAGEQLLTVKNRRNGLAHGDYSFEECGKEYTFQELLGIKKQVTAYVRQIMNNIESYINAQGFLR